MNINYIQLLKCGGIGVMPTDTIYGLVGSALSKKTVLRIYKARLRNPSKPVIVLIKSIRDLHYFDVEIDTRTKKIIKENWPGKVSIILPCKNKKYFYLHRGTNTIAFRLPKNKKLIAILRKTGPLVAPSANTEGNPSSRNIKEAKKYFGNKVYPEFGRTIDFYNDKGNIKKLPSMLIKIEDGRAIVLRGGSVKIK